MSPTPRLARTAAGSYRWPVDRWPVAARGAGPVLPYGFGGHEAPLTSAVFDPAGRSVLSASLDGTVRTAECTVCYDLDELLSRAKAQLAESGRQLRPTSASVTGWTSR